MFVNTNYLINSHDADFDVVFLPDFEEWLKSNGPWHMQYKVQAESYRYSDLKIWFLHEESLLAFRLVYDVYT